MFRKRGEGYNSDVKSWLFSTSHIDHLAELADIFFFSKNILIMHLNFGVLFHKESMIKIQLSDEITMNRI